MCNFGYYSIFQKETQHRDGKEEAKKIRQKNLLTKSILLTKQQVGAIVFWNVVKSTRRSSI